MKKNIASLLLLLLAGSFMVRARDSTSMLNYKMNKAANEETYSSKYTVYQNEGKEIRIIFEYYPKEKDLEVSIFLNGKECIKKRALIILQVERKGTFGIIGDQEKNCKGTFIFRSMIAEEDYRFKDVLEPVRDYGIKGLRLPSASGNLDYTFTEEQTTQISAQLKEIFAIASQKD